MSNKILAIGASSSKASINAVLAKYAAEQVADATVQTVDLNDYEMPIYSIDREEADGIPEQAKQFKALVDATNGIVLSLAEHNGSYTAAFKNILDWSSRLDKEVFSNKPLLLLATSPGPRGAQTILGVAAQSLPYLGAKVTGSFSVPSFYDNYSAETGIKEDVMVGLKVELDKFEAAL